jgi:hypothetical protein
MLQSCPECGYCAPHISSGPADARAVVMSEEYRTALARSPGPQLSRRWHCWSLICAADDPAEAGWTDLRAAWESEDARDEDAAQRYRAMALDRWNACIGAGVKISGDADSQQLLLLDLQRRLGRTDEATAIAEILIGSATSDEIQAIARFQQALVKRRDRKRYSVKEALDFDARARRRERSDANRWWQFWR